MRPSRTPSHSTHTTACAANSAATAAGAPTDSPSAYVSPRSAKQPAPERRHRAMHMPRPALPWPRRREQIRPERVHVPHERVDTASRQTPRRDVPRLPSRCTQSKRRCRSTGSRRSARTSTSIVRPAPRGRCPSHRSRAPAPTPHAPLLRSPTSRRLAGVPSSSQAVSRHRSECGCVHRRATVVRRARRVEVRPRHALPRCQ